jgi:hypothetical protein
MNGLPMTLKAFQSRLSPESVLVHYESQLKSTGSHETRRLTKAPWQVLMFRSHDPADKRSWQSFRTKSPGYM